MGREVELKLEVAPADAKRLLRVRALAGFPRREQDQLSVYYDTKSLKLHKAGMTLRVREVAGAFVQTIKAEGSSGGLFDRPEWETAVAGPKPDPHAAEGTPVADLLGNGGFARLRPVVQSRVRRTRWDVEREGARIEVALDHGSVCSGDSEQAICELELELVNGDVANIFTLAHELAARVPVQLGVLSKAERGFALAAGRLGKVAKAPAIELRPSMTAAEGFTIIILSCLKHFRLNEPLIARREAGALHQARVAMRRLRSALSLFSPMVRNDSDFARLRQELRWFTGQLGEARNLDVFLKRLEPDAAERPRLQAARDAHYGEIIKVLDSKRFRTLILDLLQWLLTGDWRTKRRAGKPLLAFTSKRIDRLWQDIELRGRDLARLEEEPRHRLRIDIKKIRYALEFVAGLHSGAERRQVRAGKALEELQEALGRLNDLATARLLAAEHQVPADRAQAESEEQDLESAEQIRVAAKAFAKLRKAGPYWRADLADQ